MIFGMRGTVRDGLYLRGGVWWMSYIVGGRRHRESTEYADRKSAELVLAKVRVGIKEGKWFGRSADVRTPMTEAIQEFMSLYAKPRKISWEEDECILRRFRDHVGAAKILQDIDRLTVEQFLRRLLAEGLSHGRVNRYIASLKSFWNRQIEWGKASANPVKGIKLYAETMRTEYLELGQIRALIEACSQRLRPIVQVALMTGLRKGDILGLKWDSVDFDRRELSIVQGKTKTRLVIHIGEALSQVLTALPKNPDSPFVFQNRGKAVNAFGWLRNDYLAAAKAAGLPESKRLFHTLRHTVATQLRFLGKDLAIIKEQLGHKSLRMTLRYAHVAQEELKRAADQLGERISGRLGTGQGVSPSLVTNKSQLVIPEIVRSEGITENESRSRHVSQTDHTGDNSIPQTVNASGDRREPSEDDALRRADDDWG